MNETDLGNYKYVKQCNININNIILSTTLLFL